MEKGNQSINQSIDRGINQPVACAENTTLLFAVAFGAAGIPRFLFPFAL